MTLEYIFDIKVPQPWKVEINREEIAKELASFKSAAKAILASKDRVNPKNIVRILRSVDTKNHQNQTLCTIATKLVKKYAIQVGDDDTASHFSANRQFADIHLATCIDRIADLAEFEGYDFLDTVWS